MRAIPPLLLAAALASGCLGGERTFPDETVDVVALHVNAYAETDPEPPQDVIVEISGLGGDKQERAFEADLRIVLERQTYAEPEPSYARVGEWTLQVRAPDFSSPTVPHVTHVIPDADVPEEGTYRVTVVALLATGREVQASALFHHPKAGTVS